MGIGERVIKATLRYRHWRLGRVKGPRGEFNRAGRWRLLWEDLPVSSRDTVVDAGGYAGEWTREVVWRYGVRSVVYEPVPAFAEGLRRLFAANDRVEVVQAGLAGEDRQAKVWVAGDGSGEFRQDRTGPAVTAEMVDAARLLELHGIGEIACLKLNIEGGEYGVLGRLIRTANISRVRSLLVQFHRLFEDAEDRRNRIRQALAATHREVWCYPFVWERWSRRD